MKGFLFSLSLWLTVVSTFAQRTPLKVNGTVVNNPNLTNSATVTYAVNGANVTATAAGSSGTVGTVINTGASGVGKVPAYTDATGTNVAPFTALTLSGTNASLVGVLTANGGNFTNFLRLNGVDVMTTSSSANDVRGSGTTAANDLAVFTDTTHTNIARSTSAANLGDSSSATFAVNFGLSGATDPVITAGNNTIGFNTAMTGVSFDGSSFVRGTALLISSGGTTEVRLNRSGSGILRLSDTADTSFDRLQFGGTSSSFPALKRSGTGLIARLADDSANAPFTAGTLTLTPAAADTTALTVSGGSTTGSGTTKAATFSHTANTSGNIDGVYTFSLVDTTSGATTKVLQIFGGAAGTTSLFNVDKSGNINVGASIVATSGNATLGPGGSLLFNGRGGLSATADGTFRLRDNATTGFTSFTLGSDDASPNSASLKGASGVGTDIAGGTINIDAGASTGTGRGGPVVIRTTPSGSTGSSANAYSERAHYAAKAVTLTSATATTVATIACPAAKFVGGSCIVTVFATDGTDHQSRTLRFNFTAINKAGTVTAGIDTPSEAIAVSAGTLTATITAVANGNAVDLKVDANSSLTETTLSATVSLPGINSNDTAAVTEI